MTAQNFIFWEVTMKTNVETSRHPSAVDGTESVLAFKLLVK